MDVYTEPAAHDKPEQGQSPRFLKLLDPSAGGFTFQTFDDDRARKNPALTRIVKSPPPARDELVKLNKQGAGVFVTINETDGSGRKSENITRIRAVWQEDDDGFDGAFPLHPSMVVESSPGKFPSLLAGRGRLAGRRAGPRRLCCRHGADGRKLRLRQERKRHLPSAARPGISSSQDEDAAPGSYRGDELDAVIAGQKLSPHSLR